MRLISQAKQQNLTCLEGCSENKILEEKPRFRLLIIVTIKVKINIQCKEPKKINERNNSIGW